MSEQPLTYPMNDLGYEMGAEMLAQEDPVAVSDFIESMLEKLG